MRTSLLQAALASVLLLGSCSKPAVPRAQPNESVSPAPSPPQCDAITAGTIKTVTVTFRCIIG